MSLVCAFGVSGGQLGIALGFFITPLIVHNHLELGDIHRNLQVLLIGSAGVSTIIAILIVASKNPSLRNSYIENDFFFSFRVGTPKPSKSR
jgi:hypothetical protein